MIVTFASFKGSVGKSTSAIHLAALLQESAPTVLVDHDDENHSVSKWYDRGNGHGLSFGVIDKFQFGREAAKYKHIVIDTKAAPDRDDLENMAKGSDLVIVPCTPEIMALDTMVAAAQELTKFEAVAYRILLTRVPPAPQKDAMYAREMLQQLNLPVFNAQIREAKAFKRAAERGCTVDQIHDFDNYSVAWGDYEKLAAEVDQIVASRAGQEQVVNNA
jgi:chromosome partitioning protein